MIHNIISSSQVFNQCSNRGKKLRTDAGFSIETIVAYRINVIGIRTPHTLYIM